MGEHFLEKKLSSFQIIISGFLSTILIGAFLLMLPFSSAESTWTGFEEALFTSTSAVCVTGLVVLDTATYWSLFGQIVILALIQIGGLGVISIAALITVISGRSISLMQRSMLQESISAHQIGGIVKLTGFIFKVAFITELIGAVIMLPSFIRTFGPSGLWMSIFHSISAFCNAGFDLMGKYSGQCSSLTGFSTNAGIVVPVALLIIIGGIGFLTWNDFATNKFNIKRYRMQTKVVLTTTLILIIFPTALFFFFEYSSHAPYERFLLSFFQAITPRTAGFNTADLNYLSDTGQLIIIILMLIGGSPGSTAGGMKTTTIAVLVADSLSVFKRKKSALLYGRRIESSTINSAASLLLMYLFLTLSSGAIISLSEDLPIGTCIFETASAIGTVGLSLGITPSLGTMSHMILVLLMFVGRVGGLTLIYAALTTKGSEVSQRPVEKINVG